ncbi:MAG: HAD family hydrolase [Tateyamaria sp.]|uniref:D-glycero-alpha-D-manno-heptose-1,7-bisphosphate 7-phosphatase n=1 Tax=Tateyamaria sp. TaxID=1929288 RepID=UPI00328F1789
MRPAAFLDRDGTIIELVHHLNDPADVRLIDGAGAAIARLRSKGWPVVIITNQSVIGRGKLTEAGLAEIHTEVRRQLAQYDADVDGIYFCALAPGVKDPTVIEDQMRKPGPGMLVQAAAEMDLDLEASWMVGDAVSDMLAGRNAGCHTILVRTGYGAQFAHDRACIDRTVADMSEATEIILNEGLR